MQDKSLIFSAGQEETTQAAHDSTNHVDLGIGTDEFGEAQGAEYGERGTLWLNVRVRDAFTTSASGTLAVALQDSADDSSFAAAGNISKAATAVASLTAGTYLIRQPLPTGLRRYLKLVYTIGTGAMTAGSLDAWISHGPGQPA